MPLENDVYVFPDYMLDENNEPQLWTWGGPTHAHIAAKIALNGLEQTLEDLEDDTKIVLPTGDLEKWKNAAHQIFERGGYAIEQASNAGGSRNQISQNNDVILGVTG